MGRSSTSCFKIIGCGSGDAVDDDELVVDEAKSLADKRRWSFHKRSSKHQVLNDSVISEPVFVCSSKQSQEASTTTLHSSKYNLSENPPAQEKPVKMSPIPSNIVNSKALPSLSNRIATPDDPSLNESDAIILQAAIRGYLARKMLDKLRSVVKLQAAVRGHLVRRQAIGTLRCILAIIRVQAFVKARLARQLIGNLPSSGDTNSEGVEASSEKSNKTPIKYLLSNSFARQLLETTPTSKTMYIKCVPSKSDSAWQWLARWMAITSSGVSQHEQNVKQSNLESEADATVADSEPEKNILPTVSTMLSEPNSSSSESSFEDDGKNNVATETTGNIELQTSVIASDDSSRCLPNDDGENLEPRNEVSNIRFEGSINTEMVKNDSPNSLSDPKALQPNLSSEILYDTIPHMLGCTKGTSNSESELSESIETEGEKSVIASKKSCNPVFIAHSASSANQNVASKVKTESNNLEVEFVTNTEAISAENSMFHDLRIQAAASECGTISSTLNSLEKFENDSGQIVLEIGTLQEQNHADKTVSLENLDSSVSVSTLYSGTNETQRLDGVEHTITDSDVSASIVQLHQNAAEPTISDLQRRLEGIEQPRSPEGIGRTHAMVPDPHGTPSSDISVSSSKSRRDHNKRTHGHRSNLAGKKSPSNPDKDSVGRNSTGDLSKDARNPKRSNSFKTTKMDPVDQEARLSNSSSLPGYMQATVSARAKAHVSASLKSSPDLLDNQPKKRHSLPIENGKQTSSPHMQRLASQAQ
ncbi:protein IQ-DOMAIN 32-like isoform X1 [Curcuma longa]|uniref:protein IQ-DOMAIN 32-like isoform X1 n=1 Tax=Curcuma longa TaxID=136217 RepID=UPI003D9E17A5